MPTILRIRSYRFFFVSVDRGAPPHVHVSRENMVAKFWLEPVSLDRAGGFSRAELNAIARLVQAHRDGLLKSCMSSFVVEIQEARARSASVTHEALTVDLMDGRTIVVPLVWYPRLWYGTPQERSRFEIFGDGPYIHRPDLDEDLFVAGLLGGRRSGESPPSLRKWLESRKGKPTETDQGPSNKHIQPPRQSRARG